MTTRRAATQAILAEEQGLVLLGFVAEDGAAAAEHQGAGDQPDEEQAERPGGEAAPEQRAGAGEVRGAEEQREGERQQRAPGRRPDLVIPGGAEASDGDGRDIGPHRGRRLVAWPPRSSRFDKDTVPGPVLGSLG